VEFLFTSASTWLQSGAKEQCRENEDELLIFFMMLVIQKLFNLSDEELEF
jgi:hypothetical protein